MKRGADLGNECARCIEVACRGMNDQPAGVHQGVEPAPIPAHLHRVCMMGTVVLDGHPRRRPCQVDAGDEKAILPDLVLRHRGRQPGLQESNAQLRFRWRFAASIDDAEHIPRPADSPQTATEGDSVREIARVEHSGMEHRVDRRDCHWGLLQSRDVPSGTSRHRDRQPRDTGHICTIQGRLVDEHAAWTVDVDKSGARRDHALVSCRQLDSVPPSGR